MGKSKRLDLQCFECRTKYSFSEQLEIGNVEFEGNEYIIFWCPKCGCQTFIKNGIGRKSNKIEY